MRRRQGWDVLVVCCAAAGFLGAMGCGGDSAPPVPTTASPTAAPASRFPAKIHSKVAPTTLDPSVFKSPPPMPPVVAETPTAPGLLPQPPVQPQPEPEPVLPAVLEGHTNSVIGVCISSDSKTVFSASHDATLRGWNVATSREVFQVSTGTPALAIACSPDGTLVAGGIVDHILVCEFPSGTIRHTLKGHAGEVQGLAFMPDGKGLVSAGIDCTVRLWDVNTGLETKLIDRGASGMVAVDIDPDGSRAFVTCGDGLVHSWQLPGGEVAAEFSGHTETPIGVSISAEGRYLAAASSDKTVRVWDADSTGEAAVLSGHTDRLMACDFFPSNRWLASGGLDQKIIIWDLSTKKPLTTIDAHTGSLGVRGLAVAPNGKFIASGGYDAKVRLWKAPAETAEGDANLTAAPVAKPVAPGEVGISAENMTIVRDENSGRPEYLAKAVRLIPNNKVPKPMSTDEYHIVFTKPGALFVAVKSLQPPTEPNWREMSIRDVYTNQGLLPAGRCPWDESALLFVTPAIAPRTATIQLPPGLTSLDRDGQPWASIEVLAVDNEDYADPAVTANFPNAYHANLAGIKATALIRTKQWAEFETLCEQARESQQRFADGSSLLGIAYLALASPGRISDQEYEALLADYRQAFPKSAALAIRDVRSFTSRAWKLRGGATSDQVRAEGWQALRQMEQQSRTLLAQAGKAASNDPYVDEYRLRSMTGGKTTEDEIVTVALAGLSKDPWNLGIVQSATTYLMPRWYGETTSMSAFAERICKEFAGSSGDALYCIAALTAFGFESDEWETTRGFDYDKMLAGLEAWSQQFPDDKNFPIIACRAAAHHGDLETARRLFDSVRDRTVMSDWGQNGGAAEFYEFLYPPEDSQIVWQALIFGGSYNTLNFDSTGKRLYVLGETARLREYETDSGKLVSSAPMGGLVASYSLAETKKGEVGILTRSGIRYFKNGRSTHDRAFDNVVELAAFDASRDGRRAAGIIATGNPVIFDLDTGKWTIDVEHTIPDLRSGLLSAVLSSDGKRLACASHSKTVTVFDTDTRRLLQKLSPPEGFVEAIALHSGGKRLIATGMKTFRESMIWEWDVDTGELVWSSPLPRPQMRRLAVTDDGRRIALGLDYTYDFLYDAKLWIMEKDNPSELRFLPEQRRKIADLAWSPDGRRLAVAGDGGFVRVFDVESK